MGPGAVAVMVLATWQLAAAFVPPAPAALAPGLDDRAARLRACTPNLAIAQVRFATAAIIMCLRTCACPGIDQDLPATAAMIMCPRTCACPGIDQDLGNLGRFLGTHTCEDT